MTEIDAWWQARPKRLARFLKQCEKEKLSYMQYACRYVGIAVQNIMIEKLSKELKIK